MGFFTDKKKAREEAENWVANEADKIADDVEKREEMLVEEQEWEDIEIPTDEENYDEENYDEENYDEENPQIDDIEQGRSR